MNQSSIVEGAFGSPTQPCENGGWAVGAVRRPWLLGGGSERSLLTMPLSSSHPPSPCPLLHCRASWPNQRRSGNSWRYSWQPCRSNTLRRPALAAAPPMREAAHRCCPPPQLPPPSATLRSALTEKQQTCIARWVRAAACWAALYCFHCLTVRPWQYPAGEVRSLFRSH